MEVNDLVAVMGSVWAQRDGYKEAAPTHEIGIVSKVVAPHAEVYFLPFGDIGSVRKFILPIIHLRVITHVTREQFFGYPVIEHEEVIFDLNEE